MSRKHLSRRRPGFTLVELLIVIGIIGILVALLIPAVYRVRAGASRTACANNLKQIALATVSYNTTMTSLPYGRKYDFTQSYTWSELILPQLDQSAMLTMAFGTLSGAGVGPPYITPGPNGPNLAFPFDATGKPAEVKVFICPADLGPAINDNVAAAPDTFVRGNYRGCAGSADTYGGAGGVQVPTSVGIFAVTPGQSSDPGAAVPTKGLKASQVSDGMSNTLLYSEGKVPTLESTSFLLGGHWWGDMGGGLFSTFLTPNAFSQGNTAFMDNIYGPCPAPSGDQAYEDSTTPAQWTCTSLGAVVPFTVGASVNAYAAARSRHNGGVNAALGDGSVRWISNDVDGTIWSLMGSYKDGQIITIPD
jgi:prepilin-type N-terminal cleavage/methylation domain-containing protein/prepilin-type processing-associated H-X9-DG protein